MDALPINVCRFVSCLWDTALDGLEFVGLGPIQARAARRPSGRPLLFRRRLPAVVMRSRRFFISGMQGQQHSVLEFGRVDDGGAAGFRRCGDLTIRAHHQRPLPISPGHACDHLIGCLSAAGEPHADALRAGGCGGPRGRRCTVENDGDAMRLDPFVCDQLFDQGFTSPEDVLAVQRPQRLRPANEIVAVYDDVKRDGRMSPVWKLFLAAVRCRRGNARRCRPKTSLDVVRRTGYLCVCRRRWIS